jgi:hypothetical protein
MVNDNSIYAWEDVDDFSGGQYAEYKLTFLPLPSSKSKIWRKEKKIMKKLTFNEIQLRIILP